MVKIIISFLLTLNINAADITCDVFSCLEASLTVNNTDFDASEKKASYEIVDGSDLNISVGSDSGKNSLTVKGLINDLNINSFITGSDYFRGFSGVLDFVDDISVTNNGVSGANGKNASEVCKDKFMNEDFGATAKTWFLARRSGVASNCETADYDYLKTNMFSCEAGLNAETSSTKSIRTYEERRMCKANISQNLCVKKTYDISCEERFMGSQCCNSTPNFSSINDFTLPSSFFALECRPSLCNGSYNGLVKTVTFRGDSIQASDGGFCSANMSNSKNLTIRFSDSTTSKNLTINSTTRNSVSLPSISVLNSSGTMSTSQYRLIISNINEIKNAELEVRNCFGLNGSSYDDYSCDFKPGPAFTLKLKAVDQNGNSSSGSISININESVYATQRVSNDFSCMVPGMFGCYLLNEGTSSYYVLSNSSNTGSLSLVCSPSGYPQASSFYYSSGSETALNDCTGPGNYHNRYNYTSYFYINGNTNENRVIVSKYTEANQSLSKKYANFSGSFDY